MMEAGVWLPPSQFEAAFLGTAHGAAEIEWMLKGGGSGACGRGEETVGACAASNQQYTLILWS